MAVSRIIPKDIKKFRPKAFWGFTMRQILSILAAAVLVFICSKLFPIEKMSTAVYVYGAIAALPLIYGFVYIYGLPIEKIFPEIVYDHWICPNKKFYNPPISHAPLTKDSQYAIPKASKTVKCLSKANGKQNKSVKPVVKTEKMKGKKKNAKAKDIGVQASEE